nr:aa3-type cytochrome c oxidase subunit IV [Neoroseomonas alba]
MAERESSWNGFTHFVTWSAGGIAIILVLMYLFLV